MEEESLVFDPNEVKFERNDDIEMLVIDPALIDNLDHNDPGYLNQLLKTVKMKILFFYTEMLIKVFPIYLKKNLELPDLESTHQNILEVEQLTTKTLKF